MSWWNEGWSGWLFNPAGTAMNNWGRGNDGGGGGSGFNVDEWLQKYSYMPQYTGQTESSLFDLFQRLTGQGSYAGSGNGDVNAIPFDLGLPTTGLYDALTRGIKEQYLGTPGGPQGGRINDIFAQANQMGIPEYGLNQSRLANQDLNNSLLDTAARLNENEKNRLFQILSLGTNVGGNLYGQNLGQHRANAGLALAGSQFDTELANLIQGQNQSNINGLLSGAGGVFGSMYGGPVGGYAGSQAGNWLGNQFGGTNTNRGMGGYYTPGQYSKNNSNNTYFS